MIITKSPLITRDIDLLTRISRSSTLSVHLSLISTDRDPGTPPRAARADAGRASSVRSSRLRDAGIKTGINSHARAPRRSPTIPTRARDARAAPSPRRGASYINACALRLRSSARERYLPFIEQEFPHLAKRYRTTYALGSHVGDRYREGLARFFDMLCKRYGIQSQSRGMRDDAGDDPAMLESSLPAVEQLALDLSLTTG